MARTGSTTLALPPFSGATRRLILILVGVFFAEALLSLVLPNALFQGIESHLLLLPADVAHGQLWQLITYCLLPTGITGTLFACLTIWFVGSLLEELRGSRWLLDLFFLSAIGGAAIATLLAYTRLFGLDPTHAQSIGPSAGIYGLLLAIAVLQGDLEFLLLFVVRIKIKYLVAIYILIDLATLLKSSNAFTALLELSGALAGYIFLSYAPRRGFAFSLSERYFTLRNQFYRAKRRRTAKKFEVYMGKQNREVHFDANGRYIEPEDPKDPRPQDPNDKRWMN
jgi:membrane associated rhomboid family serine protease